MHLLWPILIGVTLLIYVLMHQLEQAPRQGLDTRETDWIFFASAVGFPVLILVGVGWLLHWPFGWLAQHGWPGLLALVVVGALTGLATVPEMALGALLSYTIVTPEPALVNWFVFPVLIGCTVHWLLNVQRYGAWSEYARDRRIHAALLEEFVHHVTGPSLKDRIVRTVARAAYTLPVALAIAPAQFGSAAKPGWLGLAGTILVSVNLWMWDWYLHVILRYFRTTFRVAATVGVIASVFLAVGPVGGAAARTLAHVPAAWWVAFAAVPVMRWLITRPLRKYGRPPGIALRVGNRVVAPVTGFVAKAVTPVYLIVLEHPQANLLPLVTGVLGVMTVLNVLGAPVLPLSVHLSSEVKALPRMGEKFGERTVGHWIFDQFIARTGPQNYRFIHALAALYARTRQPELLSLADDALRVIEQEIFPFTSEKSLAAIKVSHEQAAAACDALRQRAVME